MRCVLVVVDRIATPGHSHEPYVRKAWARYTANVRPGLTNLERLYTQAAGEKPY